MNDLATASPIQPPTPPSAVSLERDRQAAVTLYRQHLAAAGMVGLGLGVLLFSTGGIGLLVGPIVIVLGWLWARSRLSRFTASAKARLAEAAARTRGLAFEASPAPPASFAAAIASGLLYGTTNAQAYRFEDRFSKAGFELFEVKAKADEDGKTHGGFDGLILFVAVPGGPFWAESADAPTRFPAIPTPTLDGAALVTAPGPFGRVATPKGATPPEAVLAALGAFRAAIGAKPLRAAWTSQGFMLAAAGVDRFELGSPFQPYDADALEAAAGRDLDAALAVAAALT